MTMHKLAVAVLYVLALSIFLAYTDRAFADSATAYAGPVPII